MRDAAHLSSSDLSDQYCRPLFLSSPPQNSHHLSSRDDTTWTCLAFPWFVPEKFSERTLNVIMDTTLGNCAASTAVPCRQAKSNPLVRQWRPGSRYLHPNSDLSCQTRFERVRDKFEELQSECSAARRLRNIAVQ
jgi:hypothetical protein